MKPGVPQSAGVDENAAIGAFLDVLARDIAAGNVRAMPQGLINQALVLAKGARIDPDLSFDDAVCP